MSSSPPENRRFPNPSRLDGFPALAEFMGYDTDAVIFRKFGYLGIRNLLYLQSRLNELEERLRVLDREDVEAAKTNPHVRDDAKIHASFRRNAEKYNAADDNDADHDSSMQDFYKASAERLELHRKISKALYEYRKALIQEHQVGTLSNPSQPALESYRRYFHAGGDRILAGFDGSTINDPEDLVAIIPSPDDDRMSQILRFCFGRCLQDRKRTANQSPHHSDIYYYPARRVQVLSYSISAVFCAVLLVGAMACLGAINHRSWKLRIGMVALFTFLFAVFVALLMNARRAEVFAATAAYAAVLVVYVSSGVGGTRDVEGIGIG